MILTGIKGMKGMDLGSDESGKSYLTQRTQKTPNSGL
jgi:hypothetical protein